MTSPLDADLSLDHLRYLLQSDPVRVASSPAIDAELTRAVWKLTTGATVMKVAHALSENPATPLNTLVDTQVLALARPWQLLVAETARQVAATPGGYLVTDRLLGAWVRAGKGIVPPLDASEVVLRDSATVLHDLLARIRAQAHVYETAPWALVSLMDRLALAAQGAKKPALRPPAFLLALVELQGAVP